MSFPFWRVAPAQTFDVRHWIVVITDILFDYLIANLAKESKKVQLLEFEQILLKNVKISKSKNFRFFVNFLDFQINAFASLLQQH